MKKNSILKKIQEIYKTLRTQKKGNFNRTLSFGDYFTDRWEKAEFLGFGKGSSVYDNVLVLGDVKVGENTWIGPNVVLDGSGGLSIGSNCAIGAGVQMYSHNTVKRTLSGGNDPIELSETIIGDNTHIGPNTIILSGVKIGNQVVIAAGSVVTNNFPDSVMIGGSPAKIIKEISSKTF